MDQSMQITPETPAMPSPPGAMSDFVGRDSHQTIGVIVNTICLTLATVFVVLRVYSRHFISHWLSWDDYICLGAYVLAIVNSGFILAAQQHGFGRHIWDVRALNAPKIFKNILIAQLSWLLAMCFIKLSFLLFFDRIFSPKPTLRYFTRGGILAITIVYTGIFISAIFCSPVQKSYSPILPGQCAGVSKLPYITGAWHVFSDFYILLLPGPFIWGLKMKTGRKVRLCAVFGVGVLACISSILPLTQTIISLENPDVTRKLFDLSIWGMVELCTSILASSSLALPPFFERHRFWPRLKSSFSRLPSHSPSSFSSGGWRKKTGTGTGRTTSGDERCASMHRHEIAGSKNVNAYVKAAEIYPQLQHTKPNRVGKDMADMEDWTARTGSSTSGGIV